MMINDLDWLQDVYVNAFWDEEQPVLNVEVRGNDRCHYLQVFFKNDYNRGMSFSDEYWCAIWAKLTTPKAKDSWCQYTLSSQIQGMLALAYLWDLVRELTPEDNTSNDAMEMRYELNAVEDRIIQLHLHMVSIESVPYLYVP
jgi:hypothetical protein